MTPRLVFAHGWGLDRSLWDAVLGELGDLANGAIVLDAGYYGAPVAAGPLGGEKVLGIGQSLGALELMTKPPAPLSGLVAIDAFARFAAGPDFPAGRDVRTLRALIQRLGRASPRQIDEIIERTFRAVAPAHGAPDQDALARGLERLVSLDGRRSFTGAPIWRLHADNDPTAPLALSDASFAACQVRERRIRGGDDHLSPVSAPRLCADLIRSALEALEQERGQDLQPQALAAGRTGEIDR